MWMQVSRTQGAKQAGPAGPAGGSHEGAHGYEGAGGRARHVPAYAYDAAPGMRLNAGPVQPKLAVSRPGDPDEREADAAADSLLAGGASGAHRAAGGVEEDAGVGGGMVEGACEECPAEEPAGAGGDVQRAAASGQSAGPGGGDGVGADGGAGAGGAQGDAGGGGPVDASAVEGVGVGEPLPANTRSFFESRLGHDFGDVRVHTGAGAARSARALDALAYTAGRDVVFGAGQYAPGTARGDGLLAHELTHVVQQAERGGEHSPSPLIQRQRRGRRRAPAPDESFTRIRHRPEPVRRLVSAAGDPEVSRILSRFPDSRIAEIAPDVAVPFLEILRVPDPSAATPTTHVWRVALRVTPIDPSTRSESGLTEHSDPRTVTAGRGPAARTTVFHDINVTITDIYDEPDPAVRQRVTTDRAFAREWLERQVAQTLFHELLHVHLRIERDRPDAGQRSQLSNELRDRIGFARSNEPSVVRLREALAASINLLMNLAEQYRAGARRDDPLRYGTITSPVYASQAERDLYIDRKFDTLVEEHLVNLRAGRSFTPTDTVRIAHLYAGGIAKHIAQLARFIYQTRLLPPPQPLLHERPTWRDAVRIHEAAVLQLFRAIDDRFSGPARSSPAAGSGASPPSRDPSSP